MSIIAPINGGGHEDALNPVEFQSVPYCHIHFCRSFYILDYLVLNDQLENIHDLNCNFSVLDLYLA